MKFYYEDKLIRTSKTHVYTHALIDHSGKTITCSATREGCEKELSRRIREIEQRMMNHENALKAHAAGKRQVMWKDGRNSFYMNLNNFKDVASFARYVEAAKETICLMKREWKIVELESR